MNEFGFVHFSLMKKNLRFVYAYNILFPTIECHVLILGEKKGIEFYSSFFVSSSRNLSSNIIYASSPIHSPSATQTECVENRNSNLFH